MSRLFLVSLLVAFVIGTSFNGSDRVLGGRIIGGQNANKAQFAYQASLLFQHSGERYGYACGGTIVSNQWILTAAHCTYGFTSVETKVMVGSILRSSGGQNLLVRYIVNHPGYNHELVVNDIALLFTKTKMVFSADVRPIALGSAFVGKGIPAIVSGWGRTNYATGETPDTLQWLETKTISNEECKKTFGTSIGNSHLCTFISKDKSSCLGDSGGPLVYDGRVIGVVSYGASGCTGHPTVYSRVSNARDFISSATFGEL